MQRQLPKRWLITGASRGLGRAIAEAALNRGDLVTATSRRIEDVVYFPERFGEGAQAIALDVRHRSAAFSAARAARHRFDCLDVVVNNAARGLLAAVEEVRDLIDTSVQKA